MKPRQALLVLFLLSSNSAYASWMNLVEKTEYGPNNNNGRTIYVASVRDARFGKANELVFSCRRDKHSNKGKSALYLLQHDYAPRKKDGSLAAANVITFTYDDGTITTMSVTEAHEINAEFRLKLKSELTKNIGSTPDDGPLGDRFFKAKMATFIQLDAEATMRFISNLVSHSTITLTWFYKDLWGTEKKATFSLDGFSEVVEDTALKGGCL